MNKNAFHIRFTIRYLWLSALVAVPAFAESNLQLQTPGKLVGRPSRPSENKYNYYLSATQTFLSSRNRFAPLDSKYISNVKTLLFNKKQNDKWEWGTDYLYSKQKYTSFIDNTVEKAITHEIDPYLTYYFDVPVYWSIWGGRRVASLKIVNTTNTTAKTRSATTSLGTQIGAWRNYGVWKPSLDVELLSENTKTDKYTLGGDFRPKQQYRLLQGQMTARLDLNKYEAFQPYIKVGYQNALQRSKSYLIQNHHGWFIGTGGSIYGAEKWNAFINYEYNKMPTGDCQNICMLTVAVNF